MMLQRLWILLLVALPLVGCDQVTKYQATQVLKGEAPISLWNNMVRLEYAVNTGAWGGFLGQAPEALRYGVLTIGVGLFLLALLAYTLLSPHDKSETIALSLILAGGIGNLIDRALAGQVVDFLNMGIGPLRTNIFNIADVAALVGVGLMLYLQFRQPQAGVEAGAQELNA